MKLMMDEKQKAASELREVEIQPCPACAWWIEALTVGSLSATKAITTAVIQPIPDCFHMTFKLFRPWRAYSY